jgi:hypothetical protein
MAEDIAVKVSLSDLLKAAGQVIQLHVEGEVVGIQMQRSKRESNPQYLKAINTAATAASKYPIKFALESSNGPASGTVSDSEEDVTEEMIAADTLKLQLVAFYRKQNPEKIEQVRPVDCAGCAFDCMDAFQVDDILGIFSHNATKVERGMNLKYARSEDSKPFTTFCRKCGSGSSATDTMMGHDQELLSPDHNGDVDCIRIIEVTANGPAALAGVCVGDVVVAMDETPLISCMIDPHDAEELAAIFKAAGATDSFCCFSALL